MFPLTTFPIGGFIKEEDGLIGSIRERSVPVQRGLGGVHLTTRHRC